MFGNECMTDRMNEGSHIIIKVQCNGLNYILIIEEIIENILIGWIYSIKRHKE